MCDADFHLGWSTEDVLFPQSSMLRKRPTPQVLQFSCLATGSLKVTAGVCNVAEVMGILVLLSSWWVSMVVSFFLKEQTSEQWSRAYLCDPKLLSWGGAFFDDHVWMYISIGNTKQDPNTGDFLLSGQKSIHSEEVGGKHLTCPTDTHWPRSLGAGISLPFSSFGSDRVF